MRVKILFTKKSPRRLGAKKDYYKYLINLPYSWPMSHLIKTDGKL